jgi:hypothetical protein
VKRLFAIFCALVVTVFGLWMAFQGTLGNVQTVLVSGSSLADDPRSAIDFPTNELAIVGIVQAHQPTREAHANKPDWLIYTPVVVSVSEVLFGDAKAGDTLVVRGLGGRVGKTQFVVEDMPAISDLAIGQRVLLFLLRPLDAGDGLVAQTPNFAYLLDDEDVAHSGVSDTEASLENFRQLAATRK